MPNELPVAASTIIASRRVVEFEHPIADQLEDHSGGEGFRHATDPRQVGDPDRRQRSEVAIPAGAAIRAITHSHVRDRARRAGRDDLIERGLSSAGLTGRGPCRC